MKKITLLAAAAALIAGSALTSCTTLSNNPGLAQAMATGMQALTLTNDQLAAYVKQSVDYMDAQNKVAPATSDYTKRLNRLVGGLKHVNNTPLNFKVYLTKEVNAFACPDGSVRVYSGIMDLMDDDQLMGIIGHEIGHVAMEHSKNQYKQQLLNTALLEALGSTSGTVAALTQGQLGQLTNAYLGAKYSRKQENEADEFGYEFLKGAGKNPYSMVLAFEKMQALEGQGNANVDNYFSKMFSSHPETAERISHMKALCQRDGFAAPKK